MFVGIELENIGPYTNKVFLDFRVNKRDKTNIDSICVLPDGEMVTKVAGIIAGNAYGKTTILDSINAIGSFINNPLFKKNVSSFVEQVEEDEFKNFILEYGKLILVPVNKKNNTEGHITVDMFIDTNDEYTGYYKYSIKYNNNYMEEGLLEEKLTYRRKYNSKKEKNIFLINNNMESEIGYKITYKNNILNELNPKARKNFEEKLKYYENFYNKYLQNSSTLDAENYIFSEKYIITMMNEEKEFLRAFLNLVDKDIMDIELDKSDEKNEKLFFIYKDYKLRYNSISSATKKICGIALNLYKACKYNGILLIDELDNSLNKNIAKFIINMYQKNIANYTSQIIFTTNNSEILEGFRRDQIFLIEKNDGINKIIKYLNFVDKNNNKRSRKDWSFNKAYNDNIIKNYPNENKIKETYTLLHDFLKKDE